MFRNESAVFNYLGGQVDSSQRSYYYSKGIELQQIKPENTIFVLLSFEGPDGYSMAGGLGTRASMLSSALAKLGFYTHLFFIGDPNCSGEDRLQSGKLCLHRWCQWISSNHPFGVYDGEEEKLIDFKYSVPEFVVEHIIRPAVYDQKRVVIMAEEWHTVDTLCRISSVLSEKGLRDKTVLLWNANNTYSFDRINWRCLTDSSLITTVSRYMRFEMQKLGLKPLVIPNGIPEDLTTPIDQNQVKGLQNKLEQQFFLFKMARFDPAKGWLESIQAISQFKRMGNQVFFPVRGGIEPYGREVLQMAYQLGLSIQDIDFKDCTIEDIISVFGYKSQEVDILNITSNIDPETARVIFAGSDAVLANSGHEPFGLVGLETMAAEGVAFVGETGEDYAQHLENAVVIESPDSDELVGNMLYLKHRPNLSERIRQQARITSLKYTWEKVIDYQLIPKLERLFSPAQNFLASI